MKKEKFFGLGELQIKGVKKDGTFTAIASDMSVDRYNEVVDVAGWNLAPFEKNPVLLWAHDHSIPAIGGCTKVWVEGNKLMFEGFFARTPFAQEIKSLVEDGIIRAFSVGFMAKKMEGNTFTESELLEISFVNVPANANAIMLSAEKAGCSMVVRALKGELTAKDFAINEDEKEVEEIVEEKGAVQDELDEEATWEKKCENMEDFWEVIYAFANVYYDEATPVAMFPALLTETLAILQTVADGTYMDGDEAEEEAGSEEMSAEKTLIIGKVKNSKEEVKTFVKQFTEKGIYFTEKDLASFKESLEVKAGRTISAKHEAVIKSVVDSMGEHCKALNDVLATAASEDEKTVKVETVQEKTTDDKISADNTESKKELVKIATKALTRALQLYNLE